MDDLFYGYFKLRFHHFVSAIFKKKAYHIKCIEIVFDNENLFHSSPGDQESKLGKIKGQSIILILPSHTLPA